ncbi:hypothetical protein GWK08_13670 [Leptobacterium flavescens]|uniref:Peptidase M1 membrane alanine aminopeptidase domain-containing protein n=1 Tax=Leptobacterium flavescens TaxID=472055 RepID=A0A6P0UN92_9FLAO|nr:M1 family aminopeptidase [Leptobacterium flavescens]NER14497.1 hypothetical protein [Leptobacterium flavescens]
MFLKLLKFEWAYHSKQLSFLIFSIAFLLFGFMGATLLQFGGLSSVNINSPYQVSYFVNLLSLTSVFAIMFFCVQAAVRDAQYRLDGIIYSTSISRRNFFLSRFLGVFTVGLFVFSLILLGYIIGTYTPLADPERLAPFNVMHYARIWLFQIVPNIFILTALLFATAILSRKALTIYVSAIAIYTLYWLCAIFLNSPFLAQAVPPSPENMIIAALADPFGISAFFEQTQYWTPFQKNSQNLSFSGFFMWNRIIWISFALLLSWASYKIFSFRKLDRKAGKKEVFSSSKTEKTIYKPTPAFTSGNKFQWATLRTLIGLELKGISRSLPFIGILLIWIVIVASEIYTRINGGGDYNNDLYPTTDLLIWLIKDPLPLLSTILIIFYSGELAWKERTTNFNGIIDGTPTSSLAFFVSKFTALMLLPLMLIFLSILIAVGFQISKGYYEFEWTQYLFLFYHSGMRSLFYGCLALFIQSLAPNKYIGMFITGLLIVLMGSSLAAGIGIEHPMLQLGNFPRTTYTNMTGFGHYSKPFNQFALYWLSVALILAVLSFKLWKRGAISGLRFRWRRLRSKWTKTEKAILFSSLLLLLVSGGSVFYNTNLVNEYTTIDDRLDFSEAYERKYKKYEELEELFPVAMKTEVAMFPQKAEMVIKTDYILENKNENPVKTVLISEREPLRSVWLENARLVEKDSAFNTYLFELDRELLPGEQLKFRYEAFVNNDGFETRRDIVNNGSYILHQSFEPSLGYKRSWEISSDFERQKRGLSKREVDEVDSGHLQFEADNKIGKVLFETVVSTSGDQMAIAPGNLLRKWTENNRNYYHYKSDTPVSPLLGYFSAAYQLKKEIYKGISIELYYHPGHDFNIDRIMEVTKISLDYCTENFGKYPFDHLRIAEIPSHWPFGGMAMPGTISMVEDNLYLIDLRDPGAFDLVAKRTIHEVAHQWWGHVIYPKLTDGASIFVEVITKYTEAAVMEKIEGSGSLWQLSKNATQRYFSGRSFSSDPEPPLYLVGGESYLQYGKAYHVMQALKEMIGEAQLNVVLKELVDEYNGGTEFKVTSPDLLEKLYNITPQEKHSLIDDLFKRIMTYDLSVRSSSYKKLSNGRYELSLEFHTGKFETDESGKTARVSINNPIQIGAFMKHPSEMGIDDRPVYLKQHKFNKENSRIKIVVDQLPEYIVIDPFGAHPDTKQEDNVMRVE